MFITESSALFYCSFSDLQAQNPVTRSKKLLSSRDILYDRGGGIIEDCANVNYMYHRGVWGMEPPPKFKNHNGLTVVLYIVSFKLWEPLNIIMALLLYFS